MTIERRRLNRDNLSSVVVDLIKDKILRGEYEEGDRIVESEIAQELDISRAPVREGIKDLINQGLIRSIPRKGNFIAKFSMEDIQEIFEIRMLLENSVLELIIKNNRLKESDYEELFSLVGQMEQIANSEQNMVEKIAKMNDLDIKFHAFLWAKSGSYRRQKILSDLHFQLRIAMLFDTKATGNLEKTAIDHYEIIKYLQLGDLENCKKALNEHVVTRINKESD